ncbi:MAG: hypothetical protein FWG10_06810 [Eubacteriaceae bacterium]|nr:hypothetical protein [Eubacteriaceae bacterium]
MENDIKTLQDERIKLYDDYFSNIIPKRMPVQMSIAHHILAERGGIDFFDFQYDYSLLAGEMEKICATLYSDTCPVGGVGQWTRTPMFFQFMESQSFVMGAGGFIQHPEVVGLFEDEYDALIEDAYATVLEIVVPRQQKAMGLDDPVKRANAVHMSILSKIDDGAAIGPTIAKLMAEYGYYTGAPRGSGGATVAPCDFVADQLRSFSGFSKDIRRNRERVFAACEAVYPLMFLWGLPQMPAPQGNVNIPLHMPTFMREKDYVEIWLPSYLKMVEQYAARGSRVSHFNEHDWMRYLDILQDFPAGQIMRFEYGFDSAQQIKDKLSKKHFIGGLYPLIYARTKTRQENIDEVKKFLDIMLPGGGYMFGFDKGPIVASDIVMDNYCAIADTLRNYAVYDNPGQPYGTLLNVENFKIEETPKLESKYAFNWEEFKAKYPYTPDSAKARFENYYNTMMSINLNLSV